VQQPDGSWRLSGTKLWTSNGGEAQLFTVFAQTSVEDPKAPGGGKVDKVTAFIVERAFGGVTNGPPEKKMGIRCSNTAEMYYDEVPIPAANVLGGVGNGFKVAMEILNNGRFGMGCSLVGTMKSVIKGVAEHASQRRQFGKRLADFGSVQGRLASMAARCYATESLAFALAINMDRGQADYMLEAAISKVFASEAAWFVADEGIQLMGGLGYMSSLPYERVLRDLRIFRIFEGTNDILRLLVAGQGLASLGRKLRGAPIATMLTKIGLGPAAPRFGAGGAAAMPAPLRAAAGAVEECAAGFGAACTALLLKHGKAVADQQLLLEKVANVAIDLTVSAAALSRAATRAAAAAAAAAAGPAEEGGGAATAEEEMALAALFCAEAEQRVRANLAALRDAADGGDAVGALKATVAKAVLKENSYRALHPTGA
jgi:very long chain acyl-CoA dehydrogenase